MKKYITLLFLFTFSIYVNAQHGQQYSKSDVNEVKEGHYNINKFKQLKEELPTPNSYRTASGAPGHAYYQQKADYVIDVTLDDANQKIFGEATVTYHNNSPDPLDYLWLQLDQNIRNENAMSKRVKGGGPGVGYQPQKFVEEFMGKPFDGGFKIDYIKDENGNDIKYTVNETMMRLDLSQTLAANTKIVFKIKWWYNINNYMIARGRSGYEHFDKDGNNLYIIAQWFPRMAVYNDVEGWQNKQYLGRGEFTLVFGDYDVKITTPSDHVLEATGVLQNRKEVFSKTEMKRWKKAIKSFDKPVLIVTQKEAEQAEKSFSKKTKTWHFKAEKVRDFAFSSSRKFIYDAQAVKIGNKTVMAISLYPKEGNPLWEEYSTKTVVHTLESYSKRLFDYPYHKAVSINAKQQGMEYPMICWNYGRSRPDGTYAERTRTGMIGVIVHEVGHNWFPMIVNSDERQWGWMDEGLNTFTQLLAQEELEKNFPSRGYPKDVIGYMSGDQSKIAPIMSQHEAVFDSGKNAYHKPTAGLYMLREFIMGHELFDHAFKTYANRWKFKHPSTADFFRTMEDASGVDLDWFWRGWFFTTEVNDIAIKEVKQYVVTDKPTNRVKRMAKAYGMSVEQFPKMLYLVSKDGDDFKPEMLNKKDPANDFPILKDYIEKNFSVEERSTLKNSKYFYEIIFEKHGGLVMPILVDFKYADGTSESYNFPAEIWLLNDKEVTRVFPSDKEIVEIIIDAKLITADVDVSNNTWPKKETKTKFEEFKEKKK
ncbi:MAG TPA: M1 family peptidase [Lutibacter sp.]|nr:M1 family peptidase [Lutibacter sp.]